MAALVNTASGLLAAALAPSSARQYQRVWSTFSTFALSHNLCPLPASSATIALFISHSVSPPLPAAPATVASAISALSYVHKINGFPDPGDSFLVRKILKGVSALRGSVDLRIPITIPLLEALLAALPSVVGSPYQLALFSAMFSTMFAAFLRISEVTASQHNLSFQQFALSRVSADLTFRSFKHSGTRPFTLSIPACPSSPTCPVGCLSSFFLVRGSVPGPAFCLEGGKVVEASVFRDILSKAKSAANLGDMHITAHSFRIGAATFAASHGYTATQIQAMGRWKSTAFEQYIRIPSIKLHASSAISRPQ